MNTNKILLIIPCYNEENRIPIQEFLTNFTTYNQLDFLFVNDGSNDKTVSILASFKENNPNVDYLDFNENKGKAETIRSAFLNYDLSHYEYIGYLDADLATPISEIYKLCNFIISNPQYEFVMGIRHQRLGNIIERSIIRHYLGRIFATIISIFVLKIGVYDTQCGAKIIQKKLSQKLFTDPFLTKWIFDVELLLRLKKIKGLSTVYEFPLEVWLEKGESKIKLIDFIKFPFQIVKLCLYRN